MAQININSVKVIKACNRHLEFLNNNPTIIINTTGATRDGDAETKSVLLCIKEMAKCTMRLKYELTDMLIDCEEYQLLKEYL